MLFLPCLFRFLFVNVVCPFFFSFPAHTGAWSSRDFTIRSCFIANVFQSYSIANMVDVLWCFKKTFFFIAKRGKRKLWQMKSQVGTKFSYVMWSCQFVRFVKPLGSKSKGLWRTVYLASPSRQVCFSLFIGQFICSFLFDFHFVRLFSFFFTCIPVGRTATNFASQFFFFFTLFRVWVFNHYFE